jgi:phosphate/sulfate permease
VANATGPLLLALDGSHPALGEGLPALGGLCFVLGIVTVGYKTIATVGSKITSLKPSSAFAVPPPPAPLPPRCLELSRGC